MIEQAAREIGSVDARLRVAVLGSPIVSLDWEPLGLRPREASLVAALALDGDAVPVDVLAARLWDLPPPSARKSIQNHVARIRRAAPALIETTPGGYALGRVVEVDARRFEAVMAGTGDLRSRRTAFEDALRWWRGVPFSSLAGAPDVMAARSHLEELHRHAEEQLVALDLLAAAPDATAAAERLVAAAPYRERRWWLLVLARYRAGQRRDALEAFQRARRVLMEGAGIGPGADLASLDALVLADDPVLLGPALLTDVLTPVSPTTDAPVTHGQVMTGREREKDRLLELTSRDEPVVVVVVGEAGIGKTTLGQALVSSRLCHGDETLWTFGSRTPDGPLAPVLDLLVDLTERRAGPGRHGSGGAPRTRDELQADLRAATEGAAAEPIGTAVAELLQQSPASSVAVVIVDDAQWVPPSSARALAASCRLAGCHLVLLARPDPLPAAFSELEAEILTLVGLSAEAIARHLVRLGSPPFDDDVVLELHRQCGGNPLLLNELVASFLDQGNLGRSVTVASLRASERLSPTVADLARQRLGELAGTTRRIVEAASVAGSTFRAAVIDEVAGSSSAGLAEAQAAGVVQAVGDGVWRFRHEVICDAIYAELPAAVRAELHDAVAETLERSANATWDRIAHHRVRAEALHPESAMDACRRAAQEASEQFAHREAAAHLERLGQLLHQYGRGDGPDALDAEIGRGEALYLAGDPAAIDVLVAAADRGEQQGESDRFGRALLCLSRLGPNTDASAPDPDLAARIERALSMELAPAIEAELAGAASLLHSMGGDHERCHQLYEDAVRTARARAPEALVRVLPFAYMALGHPRHLDRRATVAEELYDLTAHHPAGRFSALHLRFSVQVQRGRATFRATHAAMTDLAAEMADPGHRWTDAYNAACVSFLDGDLRAAEDAAAASLAIEGIAPSRRLATYGVQLVGLRRSDGRLGELHDTVTRLVTEQPDVPGWKAVRVACAAAKGDLDQAATTFDRVAADGFAGLPDDYSHSAAALLVADGALAIGDPDRMEAVLSVLEPLAGLLSWTGTTTFGPIDLTLGQILAALGRRGPARRVLQRAAATGRRMRAPSIEADARTALSALT